MTIFWSRIFCISPSLFLTHTRTKKKKNAFSPFLSPFLRTTELLHKGLARYGAISQAAGLCPIIEPEVLLDGEHDIDRTLEVAEEIWAQTFKYMADQGVIFEGILLKPSMVTPGADCKKRATPEQVADYTLKLLRRRVPPAVPGIMFLSGGQSELEATLNLNAMNQSPNPWHVSFSYARALQNSVLRTWQVRAGVGVM